MTSDVIRACTPHFISRVFCSVTIWHKDDAFESVESQLSPTQSIEFHFVTIWRKKEEFTTHLLLAILKKTQKKGF